MNVKIQGGGGGTYANTGSCRGVTDYLEHEDLERMRKGDQVQSFFNNERDRVSAKEVAYKIDNNKAKLSRTDAKFYVITVSPSSRELEKMGKTPEEQAEAMKKYVREDVMQHYAEGFGKGLNREDIELCKDTLRPEGSRPQRYARSHHREPERPEQHKKTKPEDQPHREEELRKREGRFRPDRVFPKV